MTTPLAHDRWLRPVDVPAGAAVRLIMLPYSGAGAAAYRDWAPHLPSDVGCQRVQLPGRQDRHAEPPLETVEELVAALAAVLRDTDDNLPYALFGHSMGALVAYRLAVETRRPALLAVSGWSPAGGNAAALRALADGPDAGMLDAMRRMGTVPPGAMLSPELAGSVVPAFRADLHVCAAYADDAASVDCPVVAFAGRDDPLFPPDALRCWRDRTPDFRGLRVLPGGHMFVHDHPLVISADVVHLLREVAGTP